MSSLEIGDINSNSMGGGGRGGKGKRTSRERKKKKKDGRKIEVCERTHRQKENRHSRKNIDSILDFQTDAIQTLLWRSQQPVWMLFPQARLRGLPPLFLAPRFFPLLRPSGLIHLLPLSFRFADRAPSGKDRKCPFLQKTPKKEISNSKKRIPPPLCSTQFLFRFLSFFPSTYSHSNSAPTPPPPPPFSTRFSRRTRDSTIRSKKYKLVFNCKRLNNKILTNSFPHIFPKSSFRNASAAAAVAKREGGKA